MPTSEDDALETAGITTQATATYVLRLYVAGSTQRSMRAVANIRKICEDHLEGRYDLKVVDISRHPDKAESEQIVATPTLVKTRPLPLRRFIGDLSRTEHLLSGLDLPAIAAKPLPANHD